MKLYGQFDFPMHKSKNSSLRSFFFVGIFGVSAGEKKIGVSRLFSFHQFNIFTVSQSFAAQNINVYFYSEHQVVAGNLRRLNNKKKVYRRV